MRVSDPTASGPGRPAVTAAATPGRQVLLCTDLHPGNVLAAAREPWLVIDPKPYAGTRAVSPAGWLACSA